MKREDDQQLWDLLDHSARAEVSPFFARNIVREIRKRPQRFEWLRSWLTPGKLAPATGLILVVIAAVVATHQPTTRNSTEKAPDIIAAIDPQDYDVIADLDELLTTDENNLWDEDTQTL